MATTSTELSDLHLDIVHGLDGKATEKISNYDLDMSKFDKLIEKTLETCVQEELVGRVQDAINIEPTLVCKLPKLVLPGNSEQIQPAAAILGNLIACREKYFLRGDQIVKLSFDIHGNPILQPCKSAIFVSDVETVAKLYRMTDNGPEQTTCSKTNANDILNAEPFRRQMPPLQTVSCCPVLAEFNGRLEQITGYFRHCGGIYAAGPEPESMALDKARTVLNDALEGFRFAAAADHSRALASIITPAMVFGGLLEGRAPLDISEANKSQTGKGYRNKITAAIYRDSPTVVKQRHGSVGSMNGEFDRALMAGACFISIDNVRGSINSPWLESCLTEENYTARPAYQREAKLSTDRLIIMLTSNQADMTVDLSNRSSFVRLLKQENYHFKRYDEGDLLTHVRANQPIFLGAVFAVVRAWHEKGKPRTNEIRHDLRAWAQSLDWIVQNLLDEAPLLDDHEETKVRITNPTLTWLREVAIAVMGQSESDRWLSASQLLDIIAETDQIEISGCSDKAMLDEGATRKSVVQNLGKRMSQVFKDKDEVNIDGMVIERKEVRDKGRRRRRYRFWRSDTE